jgi:DNA repair exonuclease SbcCD nuclease subunit
MMRILCIGDPHFQANNLALMKDATDEILKIIDDRKPELAVVLGDILHTHERINLEAQVQAIEWLREIAKRCPVVVLIGNHDRSNNQVYQTSVHPFTGLKGAPNITIVDTAIWDKENNFIFVPYVPTGRFREALLTVNYDADPTKEDHPRLIFAHQEFKGTLMGVQTSTHGDPWSADLPQIISGHIHDHQVLPSVYYVGTFYQQNYGETHDKSLLMLTILDEYELGKPKLVFERIYLKSVPRKVTIHLTLAELPNFAEKIPAGCDVKVVLHLDATETKSVETDPYYQALKSSTKKVTLKIDSDKASIAETMVHQMKVEGRLQTLPDNRKIYSIEEIVSGMLQDDPYTLDLFRNEILI